MSFYICYYLRDFLTLPDLERRERLTLRDLRDLRDFLTLRDLGVDRDVNGARNIYIKTINKILC
jgi:hypothetical protein